MKILIVFALICCISIIMVSSAKWTDEDDTEVDDFGGDEEFFMGDAEYKKMLYEDILNELIAIADQKLVVRPPPTCGKVCKKCKSRCTMGKPKPAKWVANWCRRNCLPTIGL